MSLLFLLFPFYVLSQNNYIKISNSFNNKTVDSITKDFSGKDYRMLIYKPADDVFATSLLLLQHNADTSYWLMRDDSIIAKGSLHSCKAFSYINFLKTGARKKEDQLKFVPPLIAGVGTAVIIYEDPYRRFYFEYGPNITGYLPDPQWEKYRKEWLDLIITDTKNIL